MTKNIICDLDLNGNKLKNVVADVLSSAPQDPAEGQFYYDSTEGKIGYYNGTEWIYLDDTAVSDVSDSTVTFTDDSTTFDPSTDNISSGGLLSTLFQKIKKWFSNLGDLAFINKDGDTSNKYLKGDGTWGNPSSSSVYLGIATGNSLIAYIKTCIDNGYKVGFFMINPTTSSIQSGGPSDTATYTIQYERDNNLGNGIQLTAWQYRSYNVFYGTADYSSNNEPTWTQNIDTRHVDGVANYLPKFTGEHTIEDASHIYVDDHSAAANGKYKSGLFIVDQTIGNTASDLQSGTAGLMTYGDGGPQIRFSYDVNGTQSGSLLFTDNDSAASGASFHFLSTESDWNVISKRFHARSGISIGTDLPTGTSVQLYVNGTAQSNSLCATNGMFFPYVGGGRYRTATATTTGALCITLPTGYTSHMMCFWIDVYEYFEDNSIGRNLYSYFVGGYNYAEDGKWHNYAAKCYGYGDKSTLTVRFCKNSSNKPCITIGETNTAWKYIQVTIRDVTIGYSSVTNDYNTGWSISFVTTLPTSQGSIDLSSQYSVHKSMSSDYIQVSEHSTSDTWYPVVWDNAQSHLYHTTNKFQFNPSLGVFFSTGIRTNDLYCQGHNATYSLIHFKKSSDQYGDQIRIGGGGSTVVGAGEAPCVLAENTSVVGSAGDENLVLCADNNIKFYTNANNASTSSIGSAAYTYINNSGHYCNSSGSVMTHIVWTGTLSQYNSISTKDANTIYLISD